ncbi:MAG: C40 family peptidase [Bacteroidales bacterium]|nr:C40 family peptidase [Bacteroidales bacterium]
MKNGISFQGYVPIRSEPSEASEMVSQVLFGETFRILESNGKWLLIALDFDSYQGWVRNESIQLAEPQNGAENKPEFDYRVVSYPFITVLDLKLTRQVILPAGSVLAGSAGKVFKIYNREFELLSEEGVINPGPDVDPEEVGKGLLSVPYMWGGRSGFGFDCSGLVQMLCRMMGIQVSRDSSRQSVPGTTINFMHEIMKGDLAFFDNAAGEIAHVGMVLDGGRILHSYNQVRIDRLDQQGIYNIEREEYTHKLRIIKRVVC